MNLVIVLFFCTGTALSWWGVKQILQASQVRQWPTVKGTVLRAQVSGVRAFHPNVVYEYTVGGTKYLDSTDFDPAGFGGRNSKRNAAETIIAAYPIGTEVTVYYRPDSPEASTLRPFANWSAYGIVSFGGSLIVASLWLALVRWRRSPRKSQASPS